MHGLQRAGMRWHPVACANMPWHAWPPARWHALARGRMREHALACANMHGPQRAYAGMQAPCDTSVRVWCSACLRVPGAAPVCVSLRLSACPWCSACLRVPGAVPVCVSLGAASKFTAVNAAWSYTTPGAPSGGFSLGDASARAAGAGAFASSATSSATPHHACMGVLTLQTPCSPKPSSAASTRCMSTFCTSTGCASTSCASAAVALPPLVDLLPALAPSPLLCWAIAPAAALAPPLECAVAAAALPAAGHAPWCASAWMHVLQGTSAGSPSEQTHGLQGTSAGSPSEQTHGLQGTSAGSPSEQTHGLQGTAFTGSLSTWVHGL
eukprot:350018-Chlamydomonas_euryale.AAC.3